LWQGYGLESARFEVHIASMQPYVTILASPAERGVDFVEERELVVLAPTPEKAEEAFRAYGLKHLPTWTIVMTDIRPSLEYLEAAKLTPGVVRAYNQ
jgi:hypothetical protein